MVSKPVKNFKEFQKKYGGNTRQPTHKLFGIGKQSIYKKNKRKTKSNKKINIRNVTTFSKLPQVRRYRSGIPVGWTGDSYRHSLSAKGIPNAPKSSRKQKYVIVPDKTGSLKVKIVQPRKKIMVKQSSVLEKRLPATDVSPESIRTSTGFKSSEFDFNKRKSLGEKFAEQGRDFFNKYNSLREEAREAGATPPPNLKELGYNAKYVTPENVSFYATRTGKAIKGTFEYLKKRKLRKEKEQKEKLYQEAQKRAEQARLSQIDLQRQINEKKVQDMQNKSGLAQLAAEVSPNALQRQNRAILGKELMKRNLENEAEENREKIGVTKEEVKKEYDKF